MWLIYYGMDSWFFPRITEIWRVDALAITCRHLAMLLYMSFCKFCCDYMYLLNVHMLSKVIKGYYDLINQKNIYFKQKKQNDCLFGFGFYTWADKESGMCAQRILRSAWASAVCWADAQADLSLCCLNRSFCWFCHEAAHLIKSSNIKSRGQGWQMCWSLTEASSCLETKYHTVISHYHTVIWALSWENLSSGFATR